MTSTLGSSTYQLLKDTFSLLLIADKTACVEEQGSEEEEEEEEEEEG